VQPEPQIFFPAPAPGPAPFVPPRLSSFVDCGSNTAYEFQNRQIVYDVIDEGPDCRLPVEHSPNIDRYAFGTEINYFDIYSRPTYVGINEEANTYYTLMAIDVDSPSTTDWSQRSHLLWLVVNIERGVDSGYEVASFQAPTISQNNYGHRMVYLLFVQQGGRITVNEQYWTPESRFNFDVRNFVRSYQLNYKPQQGNYFIVNYN
jgi:hypothetical protein